MIYAIVKLQGCTTKKGRRAFVSKQRDVHGIAAGKVGLYEVVAPTWAAVRRAVAEYDTSGGRTMGFSDVRQDTVEWFTVSSAGGTRTSVRPYAEASQCR